MTRSRSWGLAALSMAISLWRSTTATRSVLLLVTSAYLPSGVMHTADGSGKQQVVLIEQHLIDRAVPPEDAEAVEMVHPC